MFNSLSGRFLILTLIFVMLAEVLIFVPSVARFREDFLLLRLERAQIASLAAMATDDIDPALEAELLESAGVYNIVLRHDQISQMALTSEVPGMVNQTFDLRSPPAWTLMRDALVRMVSPANEYIRVIGAPVEGEELLVEVTMESAPLRAAMLDYGWRILLLSAVISSITAAMLYFAVRAFIVRPIRSVVDHMRLYAAAPEDARRIIQPDSRVRELRAAEDTLQELQTDLTSALKQKDRLAQLGGAVAKVSHDLRNILTSAQLFTDRIETSEDPTVTRLAPKLVGSITRAVNLCEATLAFGRVDEAPPVLTRFALAPVVSDVMDGERLAAGADDITFTEDVPAGLMMRADPEQLYRVILNLVRNARSAIAASGRPGEISVVGRELDDDWVIRIEDNGPGIPLKAQDHLFEPFQGRVSKGGSGLGLAIAEELVRGHGGILQLQKTGDEGTVFTITLPRAKISLSAAAE